MTTELSVSTTQGRISIWDSQGMGQPVFFIHGNSACKEVFSFQFKSELTKRYRFIAMDLPGHGKSDKACDAETTYNFEGYANVALEVFEKLQLKKPIVVGWSLGGHIGIDIAKKTKNIGGLLITGTPPIPVSQDGFKAGFRPLPLFATLFSKVVFSQADAEKFMSGVFDTQKHPFIVEAAMKTDGYARHYLVQSFSKEIGGDQRAFVETSDLPLCIVQGDKDEGINNEYISGLNYKNLFNRKVYLIKDSGHAVFWDKSGEFNAILGQFLSQVCSNLGA